MEQQFVKYANCTQCNKPISEKVTTFSLAKYGRALCMDHQTGAVLIPSVLVPHPTKNWTSQKSWEEKNQERQQGIEETARLRRELDREVAYMEIAKDLVIAKVIPKEEMMGFAIACIEAQDFFAERSRTPLEVVKIK